MKSGIISVSLSLALLFCCVQTRAQYTAQNTAQNETKNEPQGQLHWLTNLEEAKTLAAKENKKILVSFSGSDWCRNCIRLEKQLFKSESFAAYAKQNLVLVNLDFPMRKKNALSKEQQAYNDNLAEQYNSKGVFPMVLLFNGEVKLGSMNTNKPAAKDYLNEITTILK